MTNRDFVLLTQDARFLTSQMVGLWLKGVHFDAFFPAEELEASLQDKLEPVVFAVLSTDTPLPYEDVVDAVASVAQPNQGVTWRNRWGEEQFLQHMTEQLRYAQQNISAVPSAPPNMPQNVDAPTDQDVVNLFVYEELFEASNAEALSQRILAEWSEDLSHTQAVQQNISPKILQMTQDFCNQPRTLPLREVMDLFYEQMQPTVAPGLRKNWTSEQVLEDIGHHFSRLTSLIESQEHVLSTPPQEPLRSALTKKRNASSTTPVAPPPSPGLGG